MKTFDLWSIHECNERENTQINIFQVAERNFFTQSVRLAMRVAHLRGEYIFCLGRDWGSMKGYKGMIDRERV